MTHTVRDWMSTPAIVIDPDSSVSYALTLMRRRGISSLVVVSPENPTQFGILTTTDIRDKIIAVRKDPVETRVSEIASLPVVTALPEWTLTECSITMQKHNIHHLPVVDAAHNLIGMISTTDIFFAAEEAGWVAEY